MKQDQPRGDVPTYSGAVDPGAVDLGQDEERRFEPTNGAKLKFWSPKTAVGGYSARGRSGPS